MLLPILIPDFNMFEEFPTQSLLISQEEMGDKYWYVESPRSGRSKLSPASPPIKYNITVALFTMTVNPP